MYVWESKFSSRTARLRASNMHTCLGAMPKNEANLKYWTFPAMNLTHTYLGVYASGFTWTQNSSMSIMFEAIGKGFVFWTYVLFHVADKDVYPTWINFGARVSMRRKPYKRRHPESRWLPSVKPAATAVQPHMRELGVKANCFNFGLLHTYIHTY